MLHLISCFGRLLFLNVLIFCSFSVLILPTTATNTTLIICPASLAAGQTYDCFFSETDSGHAPPVLELVPVSGGSALAQAIPNSQNPGLYSLAVPHGVTPGKYYVQYIESGSGSSGVRSEVTIADESLLMLMEADRALYKPGHTARFRALALSLGQLLPRGDALVAFEVVSPEGFKLMKTASMTDASGVAHFEFPIAKEPLLGKHLARASLGGSGQGAGAAQEATFVVEEYVLPRFEVNLTLDQTQVFVGKTKTVSITGEVTATFTFGEVVVGSATLTVWSPIPRWEVSRGASTKEGAAEHRLIVSRELKLTLDGPAKFEIEIESSRLSSGTDLMIEAAVKYPVTGEEQSGTSNLPVRYDGADLQVHMAFEDGADVFRPGLPTRVRVELQKLDGRAPTQAEIQDAGELRLVAMAQAVDYQQHNDEQILEPSKFVDAILTVDVPTRSEDASCCNITAPRESRQQYEENVGCCITSLHIHTEVKVAGKGWHQRLFSQEGKASVLCASRAYAPSGQYLTASPPSQGSTGDWSANLRSTLDLTTLTSSVEYVILSGGAVAGGGTSALHSVQAVLGFWEANLPLAIPTTLSGDLKLVFIIRRGPGEATLSGSTKFQRSLQLPFPLTLAFSAQQVKPGASLEVMVEAGPVVDTGLAPKAAHAFVASLDRSAELLGQRAAISSSAILAGLAQAGKGAESTPVASKPWRSCSKFGVDVMVAAELPDGVQIVVHNSSDAVSVRDPDSPYGPPLHPRCPRPIFSSDSCGFGGRGGHVGEPEMAMVAMAADGAAAAPAPAPAPKRASAAPKSSDTDGQAKAEQSTGTVAVRKFFPETWLWTDFALSSTSSTSSRTHASLAVIAPDTITTWSLEGFATSAESGVSAVRADVPLRVFKPFFVEVRMPYDSVRGEDLEVTFAVFNYVSGSGTVAASIDVTLPPEVELVDGSPSAQLNVAENSADRITLRIRPKALGTWRLRAVARASVAAEDYSDAMERPLQVRAEGIPKSEVQNVVLELSESGSQAKESIALSVPDSAVEGSVKVTMSIVGDLLGPTISGLERLLRIPYGCGEQNMITLAPNVYVAKYLLAVGKLQPSMRQRIVNNVIVGYGRQLTYRHDDGSFSAFGKRDKSGSTWLTAFVMRVFAEVQGSGLVAVDPTVVAKAGQWLISLQESDGSFRSVGNVIHKEMMGGVSSGKVATLTACVASALAKVRTEIPDLVLMGMDAALRKAAEYLSGATDLSTYAALLRAHALALSGKWTDSQVADEALKLSGAMTSGRRFWSSGASTTKSTGQTLDVEMTGYGVLAMTLAGRLSYAFEGARWLLERRNALGGFSSTQDTVVALNALATYAAAAARDVDLQLTVKAGNLAPQMVAIQASNVDVLQIIDVPVGKAGSTTSIEVEASGKGVALIMAEMKYNLDKSAIAPCYELDVKWYGFAEDEDEVMAVQGCSLPMPDCQGKNPEGMSIMSIGLFTGLQPSVNSLKSLRDAGAVKRYEISDTHVDLYLEEMASFGRTCAQFNVTREFKVWNTQPAASEIFEYYAPESHGESLAVFDLNAMSAGILNEPGVAANDKKSSVVSGVTPSTNSARRIVGTLVMVIATIRGFLHC